MAVLAVFDGFVAINFLSSVIIQYLEQPEAMKIQLGEFLTLGPMVAVFLQLAVMAAPMAASAIWAWRRFDRGGLATVS